MTSFGHGSVADMAGTIALVGSGEFLEQMRGVDEALLEGKPRRAVFLPTAAGEESKERIAYWLELGENHYRSMGVEVTGLRVISREDAKSDAFVQAIKGASLIYLSGGNPGYLADTLRNTKVWKAIVAAHEAGASLAGCSAGACALSSVADDIRRPGRFSGEGLAVIPQLAVIPHFDRFERFAPGFTQRLVDKAAPSVTVVGIDEDTALVGGPTEFTVMGRQSVWIVQKNGKHVRHDEGEKLTFSLSNTALT